MHCRDIKAGIFFWSFFFPSAAGTTHTHANANANASRTGTRTGHSALGCIAVASEHLPATPIFWEPAAASRLRSSCSSTPNKERGGKRENEPSRLGPSCKYRRSPATTFFRWAAPETGTLAAARARCATLSLVLHCQIRSNHGLTATTSPLQLPSSLSPTLSRLANCPSSLVLGLSRSR